MSSYHVYGGDPAAAYAKQRLHALVANGVIPRYLPEWDRDPAAAWRGVSGMVAQTGYFAQPHRTPGAGSADVFASSSPARDALLAQMGAAGGGPSAYPNVDAAAAADAAAGGAGPAPAVGPLQPQLDATLGFQGNFLPPDHPAAALAPAVAPAVAGPRVVHPLAHAALTRHALMGMLAGHAASPWGLAPRRPVPRAAANWALAP